MNLPQFFSSNSLSVFRDIVTDNLNFINQEISNLPPREQAKRLFSNLYYSWDLDIELPTDDLYQSWINNKSPLKLINDMSDEEFSKFWHSNKDKVQAHLKNLFLYLNDFTSCSKKAVSDVHLQTLYERPIAYFSLEFGLVQWLHIYSGGLGILAGDILKQASDTGVPMIGVGLFYNHGYFIQNFSDDNGQIDEYPEYKPEDYPLELSRNPEGQIAEIEVIIHDHPVYVRAWRLKVGRRDLLLLDTNFEKNQRLEDRQITSHLYGGDEDTRIRQEIVLGIGGYKMLLELGLVPVINHMNEGHSAFVLLAITERIMNKHSISFHDALPKAKKGLVFTNHTLKAAGNDTFTYDLVKKYLEQYANQLRVNFDDIFKLGSDENSDGKFSMTIAGISNAGISNAVSQLHARAAKDIWPKYDLVPVTNGVHMPSWVGRDMHILFDDYIDNKWFDPAAKTDYSKILSIPDEMVWKAHMKQKQRLIEVMNSQMGLNLEIDKPIFSWFRRFTAYKRPDVIVSDLARLSKMMDNSDTQVQMLIGGKAHPKDTNGRDVMRDIKNTIKNSNFADKIAFLPEYNWALARLVVTGSDVWVNTPRRHEEASGTSGMKAAANGVLQYTTLDGWTDEIDWTGKGFILNNEELYSEFYRKIEEEILPIFKNRNENGLPVEWIQMMKKTIETVLYNYSSERQLDDYINKLYLPVLKVYSQR